MTKPIIYSDKLSPTLPNVHVCWGHKTRLEGPRQTSHKVEITVGHAPDKQGKSINLSSICIYGRTPFMGTLQLKTPLPATGPLALKWGYPFIRGLMVKRD